MKKRLCIAQIGYSARGVEDQLTRIKDIISAHRDADLIVFPELILHGHPSEEHPEGLLYRKARVNYRSVSRNLYAFVRECDARVIVGELARRGDRYHNLATYVSRRLVQSYSKTHVHWTERFVPGEELVTYNALHWTIGINICFDAAFPEVWRVLALRGAQLMVNISAVPRAFPFRHMWCRAGSAALNNQTYVVFANRPGPGFGGHSAVFDPRGERLAQAADGEEILVQEIDLNELLRWREEERLYVHRRPRLYRELSRDGTQESEVGEREFPRRRTAVHGVK